MGGRRGRLEENTKIDSTTDTESGGEDKTQSSEIIETDVFGDIIEKSKPKDTPAEQDAFFSEGEVDNGTVAQRNKTVSKADQQAKEMGLEDIFNSLEPAKSVKNYDTTDMYNDFVKLVSKSKFIKSYIQNPENHRETINQEKIYDLAGDFFYASNQDDIDIDFLNSIENFNSQQLSELILLAKKQYNLNINTNDRSQIT